MIRATAALAPVLLVVLGLLALGTSADSYLDPTRRSRVGRLVCSLRRAHLYVEVAIGRASVFRCRRCGGRL